MQGVVVKYNPLKAAGAATTYKLTLSARERLKHNGHVQSWSHFSLTFSNDH